MRCDEYVHGYIDVDPEVDIENLCLLFSNLRKGRLHYIRPVGWSVGVTINFPSPL